MNLETLNSKELADLIARANKRKKVLSKRKPATQVKAAVARVLRTSGWSFEELYGTATKDAKAPATRGPRKATKAAKGPRKAASKVAPKYRNPENESETWSGRGKRPRWLVAQMDAGKALTDFAI